MIRYLKTGQSAQGTAGSHAQVRQTVSEILENVGKHGERAVREYSLKFDHWSPANFRLSDVEIDDCVKAVPSAVKHDIEFAQAQVRQFALAQRAALRDIEVQTLPGVVLGHKNIPVGSVGCYVPGGRYPMVASAHMSVVTAKAAGVKRVVACAPPFAGKPHAAIVTAMRLGGADEIYVFGGVQAVAAMALGTEHLAPVDLLGQAEHGPGSAAILLTDCPKLAQEVPTAVEELLEWLPTADVARGLEQLRRNHPGGYARGDGHPGRQDRQRARAGADARPGLFSGAHEQLWRAILGTAHQCGVRRQGDRYQPHAADHEIGALHRRFVGRQVHQNLYLPAGADR
jgi:sulfopropanediol 3-dehydrogenase